MSPATLGPRVDGCVPRLVDDGAGPDRLTALVWSFAAPLRAAATTPLGGGLGAAALGAQRPGARRLRPSGPCPTPGRGRRFVRARGPGRGHAHRRRCPAPAFGHRRGRAGGRHRRVDPPHLGGRPGLGDRDAGDPRGGDHRGGDHQHRRHGARRAVRMPRWSTPSPPLRRPRPRRCGRRASRPRGRRPTRCACLCPDGSPTSSFGGPRSLWGARLARAVHSAVLAGCREIR